ncbi:MAG TPA: TMEM165/GDT1 family protein [Jatrophihabitans sp.]|jgi:putative Ca2+/H+ antiporter (TMEM165/GDT1 family)|uniref:TMEM165/GDT1 family protein n=1 Tax=Jatrophihabitans sp. TaxID=1932789 RepID=UPI002DFBE912|nr:TMEM165/GDT1 family protein [Jatrophihabitans sp.]
MGSLTAALIAFGVVLLVELPDKTLVASLVLSTRYRPRPVLVGVALAFAVQCVIAAAAGGVITLLPRRAVEGVVALLFAVGAFLLIRESMAAGEDDVELAEAREAAPFGKIVATSFGVLFAAEWGDASQIATAGLVARGHGVAHAVATGIGAWVALVLVAALAVVIGKVVVKKVPLHLVHRIAGVVFAVFAVLAAVTAMR